VIRIAQETGFKLEACSEINANPKDTFCSKADTGVWASVWARWVVGE
jgi:predicted methyltransferase